MENAKLIFSSNLKQLMQKNDMKQQDLIDVLQYDYDVKANQGTISSWITARKLPHMETIEAICDYFEITLSQMFGIIPITKEKSLNEIFAQNLAAELHTAGYTQEEFCQKINERYKLKIKRSSVSYWTTGKQIPEIKTIQNISNFFGHSIDYMLSDHSPARKESAPIVEEEELKNVFARNLAALLKQHHFTQEEFIEKFNERYGAKFTQQSVSEWANAEKMPRPIVLCQMEALFGVDQGYLLASH